MENPPFEDVFPIGKGTFSIARLVCWRVDEIVWMDTGQEFLDVFFFLDLKGEESTPPFAQCASWFGKKPGDARMLPQEGVREMKVYSL